jgi:hypothetical protein
MENLLLAVFVVIPVVLWRAAFVWFRRIGGAARSRPAVATLIGFNVLVFVAVLASIVLSGELYTRFVVDTTDAFALTKVSERWFERHYQPNEMGVRDSQYEVSLEIPPGRHRVTFIGDSFTAGHGVADVELRFANRIRNERPAWDVQVFNMNGWDTAEELHAVERMEQMGYTLDQVVLVYTLNDPADLLSEWQEILDDIYADELPPFPFDESYFLNLLYYRWQAFSTSDFGNYYEFIHDAYSGETWRKQQARLTALHQAVKRQGGLLRVVTFPFLHELAEEYGYRDVHAKLNQFWREQGVPHLDLLPAFSGYTPEELVVNSNDPHPNEFAHAIAARQIQKFLERQMATGRTPATSIR